MFVALAEGSTLGKAVQVAIESGAISSQEIYQWFAIWAQARLFGCIDIR